MLCRTSRILLLAGLVGFLSFPTNAQVIPDRTLGTENSIVTPIDSLQDKIEGGATRGGNLFHSFQEFNVGRDRGVYFANPAVIENILTRVTGGNPSDILGKLGVLGEANLWLINPNGIYFGPDAKLDIRGSFVATTADGVWLGNQGYFSATDVAGSQLLSVEPGALFHNALAAHQRTINNQGNLSVGGDLTLDAGYLDLQNQLQAGGDLILQALDEVKVRDSVFNPFIASADGELLIQGNEKVNIFALNHPDSGLFSGGDMVLRSENAVEGDAHYFSGGSFRIEDMNGGWGDLYSPYDPVILADEDVYLASYTGASLHIVAGGLVWIPGTVAIDAVDTVDFVVEAIALSDGSTINIDGSARPTLDIRAGVDWNQVWGTVPGNLVFGAAFPFLGDVDPPTSSADIVLGDVRVFDAATGNGGQVFLTNQYYPNLALGTEFGGIAIGHINTQDTYGGGSITIDARSEINIYGTVDASAQDLAVFGYPTDTYWGDGGEIKGLSQGDINLQTGSLRSSGNAGGKIFLDSGGILSMDESSIESASYGTLGGNPTGGEISLNAMSLMFENGSFIGTGTYGKANAGQIILNATDNICLQGNDRQGVANYIASIVGQTGIGNAGAITINTGSLEIFDGTQILSPTSGQGDAAPIEINARDTVHLQGEDSSGSFSGLLSMVMQTGIGDAGTITVNTGSLTLLDGAQIDSSTNGQGNAAPIKINARDTVRLQGESSSGIMSGLDSVVGLTAIGNAGRVIVNTGSLELLDGAVINSSTLGQGDAALIEINARDTVRLQGESSRGFGSGVDSISTAMGNAGRVTINTGSLELLDGATINSSTYGQGNAALIEINARDTVRLQGESRSGLMSGLLSMSTATGDAGRVRINTGSLALFDGAQISSGTSGQGNGAPIEINARDTVHLQGESSLGFLSELSSVSAGTGDAGGVTVNAENLTLFDGAQINSSTFGQGNAAPIEINARDTVHLQGESRSGLSSGFLSMTTTTGNAGGVTVNAENLILLDGASINSGTLGQGDAGGVIVNTGNLALFDGAQISSDTSRQGNGARVEINARDTIHLQGENSLGFPSGVFSRVMPTATGNAGGVIVNTGSLTVLDGASIDSSTSGQGNAAPIEINARDTVHLQGESSRGLGSGLFSTVMTTVTGNAGGVIVNTGSLELLDGAQIDSSTWGQGNAAQIEINAQNTVHLQGESSLGLSSGLFSQVLQTAMGNAGGVIVNTGSLTLFDGAQIDSSTHGRGNAAQININAKNTMHLQGESNSGSVSGLFSAVEKTATGDAGGVTVHTGSLALLDGAIINASTHGRGNAAQIDIDAKNTMRLQGEDNRGFVSRVFSTVEQTATGDAGGVTVNAASLELLDGAIINASTFGQGNAAPIIIDAQSTVRLQGESSSGSMSGIFSSVAYTATGDAGGMVVDTGSLILLDGARIDSSTYGQGNAAPIEINARDTIHLQGESSRGFISGFASAVAETATGDAGGVVVETGNLLLLDGARINSSTYGQGNAAPIAIHTRDTMHLQGESSLGFASGIYSMVEPNATGNAGEIRLDTNHLEVLDGAVISVSTLGNGNAGNINIQGHSLVLAEGGQILSQTETTFDAGNINLYLQDSLTLTDANSGIFANTFENSSGNGGNIFIDPPTILIQNGAGIGVNSQGAGNGGDITLLGGNLTLRNNAFISAETASSEGGNLTFNLAEVLLLRHESSISTTAGNAEAGGNGGNITINAKFLLAVPGENSDITANAFEGDGGNINISANAIYGLAFRDTLTPFSDITASSQFGLNGTLVFNPLSFPSEQGLNELPASLVDAESIIGRDACALRDGRIAGGSSFTITGRGGIPANPEDPLFNAPYLPEWSSRGDSDRATAILRENNPNTGEAIAIQPIQGWYVAADGTVHLTTKLLTSTSRTPSLNHPNCQAFSS